MDDAQFLKFLGRNRADLCSTIYICDLYEARLEHSIFSVNKSWLSLKGNFGVPLLIRYPEIWEYTGLGDQFNQFLTDLHGVKTAPTHLKPLDCINRFAFPDRWYNDGSIFDWQIIASKVELLQLLRAYYELAKLFQISWKLQVAMQAQALQLFVIWFE